MFTCKNPIKRYPSLYMQKLYIFFVQECTPQFLFKIVKVKNFMNILLFLSLFYFFVLCCLALSLIYMRLLSPLIGGLSSFSLHFCCARSSRTLMRTFCSSCFIPSAHCSPPRQCLHSLRLIFNAPAVASVPRSAWSHIWKSCKSCQERRKTTQQQPSERVRRAWDDAREN
jgi:hypothetical protein